MSTLSISRVKLIFSVLVLVFPFLVCAKDIRAQSIGFSEKAIVQEAKLIVSENFSGDSFGNAVSISGDYAVVGADSDDLIGNSSGSVFVYHFDGANWIQTQRLVASDSGANDSFGTSVSISGTRIAVGADHAGTNGQVYIFDFDGNSWLESQILTPSGHMGFGKGFGNAVSISSDRVLIGSSRDTEQGASAGAAYIFDYDGMNWAQTQKLTIPGIYIYANFGSSVSLYGFNAIIGAANDQNSGINSGSAYVFNYNIGNTTWSNTQRLFDAAGQSQDSFGNSVSIYNTIVVIGAYFNGTGGSASVYKYNGNNSTWEYLQKLTASDGLAGDNFGVSVSNSNNRIVVGAFMDDITGIANNLGSVYVFDSNGVDNYAETQKITPDDGGNYNKAFGISVALDRDTMAPDKILTGAYGDDEMADAAGSAYVYKYAALSWNEEQKLIQGDGILDDKFGSAVSISGDTAVVGAYSDQDLGVNAGAVYVFKYINSNWQLTEKIYGNDTASGDFFGYAVAIENDQIVVGAEGDTDNGSFSGSAYIFDYNGSNWIQSHKILASDGLAGDAFGGDVDISGNRILIGARFDTNINTGQSNAGSAYVFDYDSVNNQWLEVVPKLTASDGLADDNFGFSVSLDGDNAIIGAWADDDRGDKSGSAYIYHFDGTDWSELPKLSPVEIDANDYFGYSVSIEGDWALVGAPNEDNGSGVAVGAAYIFNFDGSNWNQIDRITAGITAQNFDNFGYSTAISGYRMLISSYTDDDLGNNSGSVYEYKFNGVNWFENQKLLASDGQVNGYFGYSVDISGNRVLSGAVGDDNHWIDDGAAYIINVGDRYDLKVNVSGLSGHQVALANGNDSIVFVSDGELLLSNLADTSSYNISITQQPLNPDQICEFSDSNSGIISGSDVIVHVICNTIQHSLSVRVYGLEAGNSVEFTNNGTDNLLVTENTSIFTFSQTLDDMSAYNVVVVTSPTSPNQTCIVGSSSGTIYSDLLLTVVCSINQYKISVNVTGLIASNELVLQNNGGDNLVINNDGVHDFSTLLDDESQYAVTILTQPQSPIQECFVTDGTGQLGGADVTIEITCNVSTDLIYRNGFD